MLYCGQTFALHHRRGTLLGFVYSPFRMDDFMHGVIGGNSDTIDWEVYDGPAIGSDAILFSSLGSAAHSIDDPQPLYEKRSTLALSGKAWTLRLSNARLDILAETADTLLKSESPLHIVEGLCCRVMAFLDCQIFFNFIVDHERQQLHLNAWSGISAQAAEQIEWLDYGVAVCGCVARDGCRIVAEDILNNSDIRINLVKSYGVQAYACYPLMSQGVVTGTLSFGTRTRPYFTNDDLSAHESRSRSRWPLPWSA